MILVLENSSCLLLPLVCADGGTWGPLCVQMGTFLLPSASLCVRRWGNLGPLVCADGEIPPAFCFPLCVQMGKPGVPCVWNLGPLVCADGGTWGTLCVQMGTLLLPSASPCVCRWGNLGPLVCADGEHSFCLLLRLVCADGVNSSCLLLPLVCADGGTCMPTGQSLPSGGPPFRRTQRLPRCVCVCVCVRAFSFCVWCACVASSASCGRSLRLLQVETCSALSTPNTWQSLSHWTSSFFCNTMVYAHCSLLKNTSFLGFSNLQEI